MRFSYFLFFLLFPCSIYAQNAEIKVTIQADSLPDNIGKVLFFSLPDSTLLKGSYIENNSASAMVSASIDDSMYVVIRVPEFLEESKAFKITGPVVDLGTISLRKNLDLEEVQASYSKPIFERTMDGISVNVRGTTLEQLNTLFDVLKASPRLTSPDDESIEIIGFGSPLILIDRQPIMSMDELKAVPANQVERIEIITSPSAKYKAQGSGNGVIEIYTNNFTLEGYRATIDLNGGVSTQLKPVARVNLGLSFKKKKFTMNGHLGINYSSSLRNGVTEGISDDGSFGFHSSYENNRDAMWQYYNVKMSYSIRPEHRITIGANGHGSRSNNENLTTRDYFSNDSITLHKSESTNSGYKWFRNSAFLNYTWETDTFGSVFEININYLNKVDDENITNLSDFVDLSDNSTSEFNTRILSSDRPNIGELRVNYEHYFDTTRWKLSVGGSYSLLINGKVYDRELGSNELWTVDPQFSNSYDYQEDIGALFAEVSKKWEKFGFRLGVRGEYTKLDGYSKSLQKQFMDSSFFQLFPNVSLLFEPTDTIGIKLYYNSGISRPEFSNYDPFIRIHDSLSVSYGNPYLKSALEHSFGLEFDLFNAYNITLSYSIVEQPLSTISFVNDTSFVSENTPWNARKKEMISASIGVPLELKWLSGWFSLWTDYSKYQFTEEFNRPTFYNLAYGFYSYVTFKLPKEFSILNRLSMYKWGNDQTTTKANFHWGIRLTKKFNNGDIRIFAEVSNILPTKNRYDRRSSNYTTSTSVQNNYTSFKLGFFYKFGRLKAAANIQESSSGQSDRL
ncbi:MAG: outer membrane beta-barrel protein [Crocinitomicaceae bacterium]|nr:outer membrane beta-barrel protein [Crocinitomicaceae bacterium]